MVFGKKQKLETLDERLRKKVPRSLTKPCSTCFWRMGEQCTLEINAIQNGECGQYREEKKK